MPRYNNRVNDLLCGQAAKDDGLEHFWWRFGRVVKSGLLFRRYIGGLGVERQRKLASLLLEIGSGFDKSDHHLGVRSCFSHLEQRHRRLASVKTSL